MLQGQIYSKIRSFAPSHSGHGSLLQSHFLQLKYKSTLEYALQNDRKLSCFTEIVWVRESAFQTTEPYFLDFFFFNSKGTTFRSLYPDG